MNIKARKRWLNAALLLCVIFVAILSVCLGKYPIRLHDFWEYIRAVITGTETDATVGTVIFTLRLPRIIAAVVFGAALSIAGLVYQNIFSNTMISPDLLGVSSSAACGAAVAIICGSSKYVGYFTAFLFSIGAVAATVLLSKCLKRKDRLLLSGIIVAGFARSGLGLLKYIADPENGQLESIVYWEMGSMSKVEWMDLLIIVPVATVIMVLLFCLKRRISCLSLGKNAALLGINVPAERVLAIVLSSLLVSLSTAVCGVISWVGLIIPIIAADLTQSGSIEDNYIVTGLLGSVFLLVADDAARAVSAAEIPISIMTGATGLIIFVVSVFAGREKESL